MAIISPLKKIFNWQLAHEKIQPLYKEVLVSSSEILAMGTSPVMLLPNLSENQYYEDVKIVLEYKHFTTPYVSNTFLFLGNVAGGSAFNAYVQDALILNTFNTVAVATTSAPNADGTSGYSFFSMGDLTSTANSSIYLTTADSSNPTAGDGTIKAKISYTIGYFG